VANTRNYIIYYGTKIMHL